MLWRAGQERIARERDARLAELFLAARDAALNVGLSTGQLKSEGRYQLPAYVPTAPAPLHTPEERDRMLAKLGAMFPGMVTRRA